MFAARQFPSSGSQSNGVGLNPGFPPAFSQPSTATSIPPRASVGPSTMTSTLQGSLFPSGSSSSQGINPSAPAGLAQGGQAQAVGPKDPWSAGAGLVDLSTLSIQAKAPPAQTSGPPNLKKYDSFEGLDGLSSSTPGPFASTSSTGSRTSTGPMNAGGGRPMGMGGPAMNAGLGTGFGSTSGSQTMNAGFGNQGSFNQPFSGQPATMSGLGMQVGASNINSMAGAGFNNSSTMGGGSSSFPMGAGSQSGMGFQPSFQQSAFPPNTMGTGPMNFGSTSSSGGRGNPQQQQPQGGWPQPW